jgi:hypothetical protein
MITSGSTGVNSINGHLTNSQPLLNAAQQAAAAPVYSRPPSSAGGSGTAGAARYGTSTYGRSVASSSYKLLDPAQEAYYNAQAANLQKSLDEKTREFNVMEAEKVRQFDATQHTEQEKLDFQRQMEADKMQQDNLNRAFTGQMDALNRQLQTQMEQAKTLSAERGPKNLFQYLYGLHGEGPGGTKIPGWQDYTNPQGMQGNLPAQAFASAFPEAQPGALLPPGSQPTGQGALPNNAGGTVQPGAVNPQTGVPNLSPVTPSWVAAANSNPAPGAQSDPGWYFGWDPSSHLAPGQQLQSQYTQQYQAMHPGTYAPGAGYGGGIASNAPGYSWEYRLLGAPQGGNATDFGVAPTIGAPAPTTQSQPQQQQPVGGPNFDSLGGLLAPSLQVGGGQATAGTSWDPVAEGAKLQPIGNAGATPQGNPGMLNPSGGSYTPTQLPYMQGFFDPSGHAAPVSAQAQNAMTTTQQGALSSWYNDVLGIAPEDMAKQQAQNSPTTNLAAPNSFA